MPDVQPGDETGRFRVRLAQRLITIETNWDEDEALGLMVIRAAATGQSLEDVALDVLDGVLRFD